MKIMRVPCIPMDTVITNPTEDGDENQMLFRTAKLHRTFAQKHKSDRCSPQGRHTAPCDLSWRVDFVRSTTRRISLEGSNTRAASAAYANRISCQRDRSATDSAQLGRNANSQSHVDWCTWPGGSIRTRMDRTWNVLDLKLSKSSTPPSTLIFPSTHSSQVCSSLTIFKFQLPVLYDHALCIRELCGRILSQILLQGLTHVTEAPYHHLTTWTAEVPLLRGLRTYATDGGGAITAKASPNSNIIG
ncbi:hypothetical protein JB92DRAFT_1671848 [Gautieria morchelliformis]|nr:hypothetical protein JB92DRAFT_1671848 [Gautieria morchelliformis]